MSRFIVSGIVLIAFAASAHAQRGGARPGAGRPAQLPLSPGVMPGSPIGPGTQFIPQPRPQFIAPSHGFAGGTHRNSSMIGFGNSGPRFVTSRYGLGYGFGGFGGYGYGSGLWGYPDYGYGYDPDPVPLPPPAPQQPTTIALANEFPATLTVQLPVAGEIWLDGKKAKGDAAEEWLLTSPVLQQGQQHTFTLKAQWVRGGKTYEANRTVTVGAGARSRLGIISGDEVKE